MEEEKCCELLNPEEWDKKTIELKNRNFVKKHYTALFYMPIGLDKVLKGLMKELDEKKLLSDKHPFMLWRNEGMFGGDICIAVKKKDPAYETETISGSYFTMFFEGKGYQEAGKWHKAMKEEMERRKLKAKEVLSEYALCPGCAKKYGKVQAILYGRL